MTDTKAVTSVEDLESSRTAVALRHRKLLELGGIVDAVVTNEEWLYMLTEETRNSLSIEGHFATEKQLKEVIQGRSTTGSRRERQPMSSRYLSSSKHTSPA